MTTKTINDVCRDTITKTLTVFQGVGSTIELRALAVGGQKNRTASGYFNDIQVATNATAELSRRMPKGIYFCLNPISPDLLSRAQNRIQEFPESTTSDSDILRRRWLYLDLDPVRASGISSTDDEHAAALLRANDVSDWLKEQGFPEPILGDSGNGAHLHYPIDLSNDADSTAIVKAATAEIASRYSDNKVSVDVAVVNPARICRLYGTWARKGDDTEKRPHRRSALRHVPDLLENGWNETSAATADVLQKIEPSKSKTISTPNSVARTPRFRQHNGARIDLRELLTNHGIDYNEATPTGDYTLKLQIQCPFNDSHIGTDAFVAEHVSGAVLFKCSHNSCAHNKWNEFKEAIGFETGKKPRHYDHAQKEQNSRSNGSNKAIIEPLLMTVKASEVVPKELDWLWMHRFLTGHINILAGDPGLGKSLILIDIAARASSGRDWPDKSPCKQCSVLYSTTEDGIEDTVVPRLIAAGADLERVQIVQAVKCRDDSELPLFLNEHLSVLDDKLTHNPEIKILIIDTLQSHIGSAIATNNNSSVRGVMTPLKRLAEKHHVAILCIEHLTKSKTTSGENATYRVQGSIAFAGSARSVWIVAKDQEDATGKRRYVQASKTNLAPDNAGIGLAYEIIGETGKPCIRWLETNVATPVDQLLSMPDGTHGGQSDGGAIAMCCDWLRATLTEATPAKEVEAGAKSEMFSAATLRRAKEELGIRSEKRKTGWHWVPSSDMEATRTDAIIEAAES